MKRPIVLALNPSVDAEWCVAGVRWEEKNSIESERRWAGGKGVNVARWLKLLGSNPLLLLSLGGEAGREISAHLKREKISMRAVPIRESSRVNVIVTTRAQGQLRFNPAGPRLSRAEWLQLLNQLNSAIRTGSMVILSGSLPRGVPVDAYAQIIRSCRKVGVPVLLDCDGPALVSAVRAKPFLVKPNDHELAGWAAAVKLKLGTHETARAMSSATRGWVLVSRGSKRAMLLNDSENVSLAEKPQRLKARNTVGAGDALLAAVAREIELGSPPQNWLRRGLIAGAASTQNRPGVLPRNR